MTPNSSRSRLTAHVDRLGSEHPPIDPDTVDYTVRRPELVARRYGGVLNYMARTELEVERNVLELNALLPDPPEIDRRFYQQVWGPQEARHGQILDELQARIGRPPAATDLTTVSVKLRLVGLLAELTPVQDVVRMLYYLTGMTTERSALLAYHRLHDGLHAMGERAIAASVIAPIRRQEPGHYAFYQMSAQLLWRQLTGWQRWLVRCLRAISFSPVGAKTSGQVADAGQMMLDLGVDGPDSAARFAMQVARVECDLLHAADQGMTVPPYVARAFSAAVAAAEARAATRAPRFPVSRCALRLP